MGDLDLPGVLVSDLATIWYTYVKIMLKHLKRHFNQYARLFEIAQLGPKIQAVYIWGEGRRQPELLHSLPSLKIVWASAGAGLDHLDLGPVASFGVKVANTPHAVSSPTADLGDGLAACRSSESRKVNSQ